MKTGIFFRLLVFRVMCGTERIPCGYAFTPGKVGEILPGRVGRKEEAPCGYTITPQKHGQERGNYGINKSEGKNNSP